MQTAITARAGIVTALRINRRRRSVTTEIASARKSVASAIFACSGAANRSATYRKVQESFSEQMKYSSPSWICRRLMRRLSNQVPFEEPRSSM